MACTLKKHLFAGALYALTAGCALMPPPADTGATAGGCQVQDQKTVRGGRQGLQMTNSCEQCAAVAFAYTDSDSKRTVNDACYVPAETRVIYWRVNDYQILSQKTCKQAEREGFSGIDAAQRLQENFRSGRCEMVGDFAD